MKAPNPDGTQVRLQPLRCIHCQTDIPAEMEEVVWVCQQCGQAQMLEEGQKLVAQEIHFHANVLKDTPGHPFWVAEGRIHMERYTFWGLNNIDDAMTFWKKPRTFFVAAFDLPLENVIQWGKYYLQQPIQMKPGIPVDFLPIILEKKDVQAIADIIAVGIEASRPDKLKEIHFTLSMSEPELWILP
jgi:hypothetical protein